MAAENVTPEFEEFEIETKDNVLQEIQNLSKQNPDPPAAANPDECEFDPNLEIKTEEVEEVVTNEMVVKMSSGQDRTVTIREGRIIPNILKDVVWANEGDDEPLEPLVHSNKTIDEDFESQDSLGIQEYPGFSDDEWTIETKSKKKKTKKKSSKKDDRGIIDSSESQMPLGNIQFQKIVKFCLLLLSKEKFGLYPFRRFFMKRHFDNFFVSKISQKITKKFVKLCLPLFSFRRFFIEKFKGQNFYYRNVILTIFWTAKFSFPFDDFFIETKFFYRNFRGQKSSG